MSLEKERRAGGPRVPLQTLVEVGVGTASDTAFEAEAVDVTTAGMRMKTAYLPEVGEPLICRFEGGGTEVVVQGQVAWRNEDNCGGDFGVQFLEMDQESLDALRTLSGEAADEEDHEAQNEEENESSEDDSEAEREPSAKCTAVRPGTRVRLHIEGLGSPMKARVRDGGRHDVLVGSNLEFLRVGRSLNVENVEEQQNRPARIERVSVEVDPTSHVPQLVVAMRYLDTVETGSAAASQTQFAEDDSDSQGSDEHDGDGADDGAQGESAGVGSAVWSKMKNVGPTLSVLGSVAQRWGIKAKDAVSDAAQAMKTKADQSSAGPRGGSTTATTAKRPTPRRTTSAPPKAAYAGAGLRKQHRDDPQDDARADGEPGIKKHLNKRTAMTVIAAAMVLLGAVALASTTLRSDPNDPSVADNGSQADDAQDAPIIPGAMGTDSSGGLTANVPLFGQRPMSTATPMAPMAGVTAMGNGATGVTGAMPVIGNAPPIGDDEDMGSDDEDDAKADTAPAVAIDLAGSEDDEEAPAAKPASKTAAKAPTKAAKKTSASTAATSFGRGKVSNPVVLTLKMNQKVKELRGAPQSNGFSVDVIGARGVEPAAGLRRQDGRIAEAKIVNHGTNSQLTIRFKGPTPGYRVQANGSSLRILIDSDKKTASTQTDQSKKKR